MIVCDDDATLELKVKTVRYFKGLEEVQSRLLQRDFTGDMVASASRHI
jgi:glucosamine-6-phosphate deaminase